MSTTVMAGPPTMETMEEQARTLRPTRSVAFNLYISHALSTWNARGYEFAAILFTAAAYPGSLSPAALRMVIVFVVMIFLSASVGGWVNGSPDRLRTMRSTILVNRGIVIAASFVWFPMLSQANLLRARADGRDATSDLFVLPQQDIVKGILFAVAILCGIIERLSSSGNLISMERDWIVTIAAPPGEPYDLTHLNAVMRRIDLVCKLVAPIVIAAVISSLGSTRLGVVLTGLTSAVCLPIELVSAKRAWNSSLALQKPKPLPERADSRSQQQQEEIVVRPTWIMRINTYISQFGVYFSSPAWIPSLALAMLHYSMVTWRPTFVTYLINAGYSLNFITAARAVGSLFEISSTIVTPIGVRLLGRSALNHGSVTNATSARYHVVGEEEGEAFIGVEDEEDEVEGANPPQQRAERRLAEAKTMVGLQRTGLWGITSQVVSLMPVVYALWVIGSTAHSNSTVDGEEAVDPSQPSLGISLVLFTFLAASRFGVWVFDLTTQQITQSMVPERERSTFAGVETSVVNVFDLFGAMSAIICPRPDQFKWLVVASWVVVTTSWVMYSLWVRRQRQHLVHWSKFLPDAWVKTG